MALKPFVAIPQNVREWFSWLRDSHDLGVLYGQGTPEGNVAAPVGTLYRRLDGGAGTTLYVKETGGSTSTGWDPK